MKMKVYVYLVLIMILPLCLPACKKNDDYDTILKKFYYSQHYAKKLDHKFKYTIDVYGIKYEGISGNIIDDEVLIFGAYEKHILFLLRDTLKKIGDKKGIVLDIGANTGQHAMYLSQFCKHIYAIEPYPPVLDRFKKMIVLNNLNNITIYPVGFGDKDATLPFYPPEDTNLGMGTFISNFRKDENVKIDLPIVNGDQYLASKNVPRLDLIKLDIEGYEKTALHGLKKTLSEQRPIMMMEFNTLGDDGFKSMDELVADLPNKYLFFEIWGELNYGKYELKPFDQDKLKRERTNLPIVPLEKENLISKTNKI